MRLRDTAQWLGRHPMVWDATVAVLLSPVTLGSTLSGTVDHQLDLPRILLWLWGGLYTVPLVWRRTRPDIAAAGVALACLIQVIVIDSPLPAVACVPLVVHAVIAHGDERRARGWLGLALAGSVAAGVRWTWSSGAPGGTLSIAERTAGVTFVSGVCAVIVTAAWFAGRFARERRISVETLRQRAADLERERDQNVRLAAQEERARIAREMHDIVAHSLSVIVVQADGGSYLANHEDTGSAAERLAASGDALDTIGATARRALAETRRLVGVLRDDGEQPAELAPTRGLHDIESLVSQVPGASLEVTGDPGCHPPLTEGAELTCYRVVQESLTNVLKHAGAGARAHVSLSHTPETVEIRVVDDGQGSGGDPRSEDGAGHGLVGMHERVAAWGGHLEARDRLDRGFQVHAVIPTSDHDPPPAHIPRHGPETYQERHG